MQDKANENAACLSSSLWHTKCRQWRNKYCQNMTFFVAGFGLQDIVVKSRRKWSTFLHNLHKILIYLTITPCSSQSHGCYFLAVYKLFFLPCLEINCYLFHFSCPGFIGLCLETVFPFLLRNLPMHRALKCHLSAKPLGYIGIYLPRQCHHWLVNHHVW